MAGPFSLRRDSDVFPTDISPQYSSSCHFPFYSREVILHIPLIFYLFVKVLLVCLGEEGRGEGAEREREDLRQTPC